LVVILDDFDVGQPVKTRLVNRERPKRGGDQLRVVIQYFVGYGNKDFGAHLLFLGVFGCVDAYYNRTEWRPTEK